MSRTYRNESKIVESVSRAIERAHLYSMLAAGIIAAIGSTWFMWASERPSLENATFLFLGVIISYLGVNLTFASLLRYAIKDFVRRVEEKGPGQEKYPPPPPGDEWDYIKVLGRDGEYKWVARNGGGEK
jgi:hypothetical protein